MSQDNLVSLLRRLVVEGVPVLSTRFSYREWALETYEHLVGIPCAKEHLAAAGNQPAPFGPMTFRDIILAAESTPSVREEALQQHEMEHGVSAIVPLVAPGLRPLVLSSTHWNRLVGILYSPSGFVDMSKKISAIKALREMAYEMDGSAMGLKEAKDYVDNMPIQLPWNHRRRQESPERDEPESTFQVI